MTNSRESSDGRPDQPTIDPPTRLIDADPELAAALLKIGQIVKKIAERGIHHPERRDDA